jgi:hypothetical protein
MTKHYWHAFWYEKLFEKHPQPHCQTRSKYKTENIVQKLTKRTQLKGMRNVKEPTS